MKLLLVRLVCIQKQHYKARVLLLIYFISEAKAFDTALENIDIEFVDTSNNTILQTNYVAPTSTTNDKLTVD